MHACWRKSRRDPIVGAKQLVCHVHVVLWCEAQKQEWEWLSRVRIV